MWAWFQTFESKIWAKNTFQRMAQQHLQAHWAKNIQHLSNDGHSGNVAKCIKPTETTTAPKRSTTALKTKSYDVADDAANILFQNHKITTRYVQRNNVRMSLIF
eukprot:546647_1